MTVGEAMMKEGYIPPLVAKGDTLLVILITYVKMCNIFINSTHSFELCYGCRDGSLIHFMTQPWSSFRFFLVRGPLCPLIEMVRDH
jgi:hypothetical protein